MSESIQTVILSVGTELTEGIILNTHFRFLGSELKRLKFEVIRSVQIPDNPSFFSGELLRAVENAQLVFVTGGLGPTSDDLTREIVARIAGVELKFRDEIWQNLLTRFHGRNISDTNKKQALIPEGFDILTNDNGTAPGFAGYINKTLVIALPGPPRELEPMFQEKVVRLLDKEFRTNPQEELTATVMMIPESSLEAALQAHSVGGVSWGTRVTEYRIVLTLRGGSAEDRGNVLQNLIDEMGDTRIRQGDIEPNYLLYSILAEKSLTIAIAESCTGGLLGKMMTDIPGSSRVFWGSLVVYSNNAKKNLLGVDAGEIEQFGAVSNETALSMVKGLMERADTDVGLAVTGIAGPSGGSLEKPVGTVWIAARNRSGREICRKFNFSGNRDSVRRRSAVAAILMAESIIRGRELI